MKERFLEPTLTLVTVVTVLLVAVLAGGSLWALRHAHGQVVHTRAARSVLEDGVRLTAQLASLSVVRGASEDADWQSLSPLVQSLYVAQKGLQYVSVSCDGVTVFHQQTRALDAMHAVTNAPDAPVTPRDVRMMRRLLNVGTQAVPVVVFAARFMGEDGKARLLELALRKEAVEFEESAPTAAIASMFKVSLATVLVSFCACAVLVVWMMKREQVREQRRRADEHLAFAGVLANGIVHDFRNPMSSLRLDVQMLQKESSRGDACRLERLAKLSERIRSTLDRMDKVFQEFLSISRPATEQTEPFDLAGCLRECLGMMTPRLEQKRVQAHLRAPAEAVTVAGRRASLQRAFINILTNAEQFSPEGGAVIVSVEKAQGSAVVEVLDQGPGIPAPDIDKVFDMFYSARPGGTGLGLFLAKTAVEASGGTISVSNGRQGGACFRVALPLVGNG